MSIATSKREQICESALRIASRDGLLSMTLDNVAKEAGISKGGVMYHFPTKDELVRGMLEYFGSRAEQLLMRRMADDPQPQLRWARAMITSLFPLEGEPVDSSIPFTPEAIEKMMLTTIAAAVNAPHVLDPIRDLGKRLRERLQSDPDGGLEQLLMWLAVDGLLMWQFIGLIDRDDPWYDKIGDALRARVNATTRSTTTDQVTNTETDIGP